MFAILDTSVLVSGLRSKRGASFQIIQAIRAGDLRISVSVALVLEYESVLLRPGLIPCFATEEIHRQRGQELIFDIEESQRGQELIFDIEVVS